MVNHCICLEYVGDNGRCPVHGGGYQAGPASMFVVLSRENFIFEAQDVNGAGLTMWGGTHCRVKAINIDEAEQMLIELMRGDKAMMKWNITSLLVGVMA